MQISKQFIILLFIGFTSIFYGQGAKDNEQLATMYRNDQKDRQGKLDWQQINKNDEERRETLEGLIANDKLKTGNDYYHAAMIFQHGKDTVHSGKAVKLMRKAVALDPTRDKWLLAAEIDRDLMRKNKPQIYGTQHIVNEATNGKMERYKIDTTQISDAQRREYNVRTLAEQEEYVLNINKKSLITYLMENRDIDELIARIKDNRINAEDYNLTEAALNNLGYKLLSEDQVDDALKVFKLNTKHHPKSVNVYDSYGEALAKKGKSKMALIAYKKSLQLDPENKNAKIMISTIKTYE